MNDDPTGARTSNKCAVCGEPATQAALKDPFGKSNEMQPLCGKHGFRIRDPEDLAEIERLLARCAELERFNVGLATESERRRATLERVKEMAASFGGPATRIEMVARQALSGDPDSAPETCDGWRLIETVPDPQIVPVLGAIPRPNGGYTIGEMHQTEDGWYWAQQDASDVLSPIYPAYWQPLPKPPGSAVKAGDES